MKIKGNVKPFIWGVTFGAIALAILGFTWGGWVTGSSSRQAAEQMARNAVIASHVPSCVQRFKGQSDFPAKLAALKATTSWDQGRFIENGGWATLTGSHSPNSDLARACAENLLSTGSKPA